MERLRGVSGLRGLALVALLRLAGGVVMRLFQGPSKCSKALAIFMLPALLLTYLRTKTKAPSTQASATTAQAEHREVASNDQAHGAPHHGHHARGR